MVRIPFNIEEYLDNLPEDTEEINISYKDLTYIPESILRFSKLKYLYCFYNHFTQLPELPQSLTKLYCSGNQLIQLPKLPQSLKSLECYINELTRLPELPQSLKYINYYSNNIGYCLSIWSTRKLQRFIKWFYFQKYKPRFIVWKWKAIENIAIREGHQDRMWEKIQEAEGDLETVFC